MTAAYASADMCRHLLLSHFFSELQTDLGLSHASHSPEKTRVPRHQFTVGTMNKNLPKFVEHFFPPGKQWTGVGFLRYVHLHLPFTGIGRENIVMADKYVQSLLTILTTYQKYLQR